MHPELTKYIREARAAGKAEELIKTELRTGGWGEADLAQAFAASGPAPVSPGPAPVAVPPAVSAAPVVAVGHGGMGASVGLVVVLMLAIAGFFGYQALTRDVVSSETASVSQDSLSEEAQNRSVPDSQTGNSSASNENQSRNADVIAKCKWTGIEKVTRIFTAPQTGGVGKESVVYVEENGKLYSLDKNGVRRDEGHFLSTENYYPYSEYCETRSVIDGRVGAARAVGYNTNGKWFFDPDLHKNYLITEQNGVRYEIYEQRNFGKLAPEDKNGFISIEREKREMVTGLLVERVEAFVSAPDESLSKSLEELTNGLKSAEVERYVYTRK